MAELERQETLLQEEEEQARQAKAKLQMLKEQKEKEESLSAGGMAKIEG